MINDNNNNLFFLIILKMFLTWFQSTRYSEGVEKLLKRRNSRLATDPIPETENREHRDPEVEENENSNDKKSE